MRQMKQKPSKEDVERLINELDRHYVREWSEREKKWREEKQKKEEAERLQAFQTIKKQLFEQLKPKKEIFIKPPMDIGEVRARKRKYPDTGER